MKFTEKTIPATLVLLSATILLSALIISFTIFHSSHNSRYQVSSVGKNECFIIDTKTGQVWIKHNRFRDYPGPFSKK